MYTYLLPSQPKFFHLFPPPSHPPIHIKDKFVSRHKFIENFQLLFCRATAENSVYLASILRNSESLTDVTFDHNPLKGEGIVNLFLGMKENPNCKIRQLSLQYCEAYSDFCEALVPLLGNNKTLIELNLRGNFVGQEGVMFLATALMNNNTLRVLDLSANNITDDQELYGHTLLTPSPSHQSLLSPSTVLPGTAPGAGGLVSAFASDFTGPANGSGSHPGDTDSLSPSSTTAAANDSGSKSNKGSSSNLNNIGLPPDDGLSTTGSVMAASTNPNGNANGSGDGDGDGDASATVNLTTSTLTYLADAVSREESAITHLNLADNSIGNNGGEIMLQALRARKAIVVAKKKTAPVLVCQVTERMKTDLFSKILDINRFMLDQEKKRSGKKRKGKKGKK